MYTRTFHQLGKDAVACAGGKGANLGEMTNAGFPVPPGFVLTTAAYDAFVETHGLQEPIVRAASAVRADEPRSSEVASAQIRQLFHDGEIPAEIVAALLAAYAALDAAAVAVRSSATAEDLPDASFAGQQDTFLNVQGEDALLAAVKQCWASLWTARAITYRLKQGIAPQDVSLAVVVQQQIASEVSGVAFSLNPQNNSYDEVVINSNFGLGESIVSGQVTPDTFIVNKVSKATVEKQLSTKDYVVVTKEGGGVHERAVEAPASSSLTDAHVAEVAALAIYVESYYEMPMDIEWTYADGELYLLQARPITTYVPLPKMIVTKPGEQKNLYLDVIVLTQGFSEPLSVLGSEIWGKMLTTIKGSAGMIDQGMDGTVLNVDGRQYLHVSNMMKGFSSGTFARLMKRYDTPTRTIIESIDFQEYTPAERPAALRGMNRKTLQLIVEMVPDVYRGFRSPAHSSDRFDQRFVQDVQSSKQLVAQERDFQNLIDELLGKFKAQTNTSASVLAPAAIGRLRLHRMFKDDDVKDLLVVLEMDLHGNPTAEMGYQMVALAQYPEVQQTESGELFAAKVNARTFSPTFLHAYDDFMEKYGARCIKEIDIATPRPYEDLPAFFEQLRTIDVEHDIHAAIAKRRADAYDRLLQIATRKGKARQFKRLAALQRNMGYREAPKYFFILIIDMLHRKALQLGEVWVAQGRLDHAYQVFDLNSDQITQAQHDSTLDLRSLIETNLAPRRAFVHVQEWPRVVDSRGKIFRAPPIAAKAGELVGDPIAPGVVRGRANVLHSPYEKPLKKGEILVTRASDPGWTPLFMNASGVVLEIGGALQHGAVIAREYGLPCVSGIAGVTTAIRDGQEIEVDGSNGIVRILEAA